MSVRLALLAPLLAVTPLAAAAPAEDHAIKERAEAEKFDGVILIGEADGSYRILTIGADPVPVDAVWRWASITKQLAAVLTMQEVAKGKLDLDAPVTRYWPEWKAPDGANIRIRDLLLHNSGLPQPDTSEADADGIPSFYRAAAVSPADAAGGFCAGAPRAAPPAKFEYNNCDTIVLAEILRRVTGSAFEVLLRERLAGPLGLKSVGVYHLGGGIPAHVQPNGEYAELDPLLNLGVYGASGGAYGSIADLWSFDRALLKGDLLPAGAREAMWQSERSNGFYGFHQWIFPAKLAELFRRDAYRRTARPNCRIRASQLSAPRNRACGHLLLTPPPRKLWRPLGRKRLRL
ncbi:serine hydrolase domain-containing protein [Sphingopyxis sp. PET50]|uniref:serine hydrolase domain-containing protein n=1 Tax=Sphingopyxis sp. PET50 TaxID=2976533 RepID=UPI0021B014B9|nr:serine hydrolase domain-containing protein [Sphingopyxis sp. PET50]